MTAQLRRRRRRWGIVLPALVTGATSLGATQAERTQEADVLVPPGVLTGRTFVKEMSPDEQRLYGAGLINGMFLAPVLGAPRDRVEWLTRCVEHMTNDQGAAIILKHLQSHPERWHKPLNLESWLAIREACSAE
ncbi:hypothetical protein MELA_02902 [Candidatus Methylomirabilis lanthanidiphila]|uniref:Rap1a immunity protein domain-containing protein n=1 Tax=Candidatus Methylomirabilis lanthanidiphila TaxID=2211376 RepID=A0A564ZME6_9BACT|nr:hypothetical protein MELA_02902 [Candidatus Methylomirabilis lanthanidiphila]